MRKNSIHSHKDEFNLIVFSKRQKLCCYRGGMPPISISGKPWIEG
jgi:hypothetical protein